MMQNKRTTYSLLFSAVAVILLAAGCGKGPETVTVQPSTSDLFSADSQRQFADDEQEQDFIHIKLSETGNITSFDPLFANNYSELRVFDLLYEGLTRLNNQGTPAPAIARRWEVNADSSRFTFYLNRDARFYDSPAFPNGNGREITSDDVKRVFERMASAHVPAFASHAFTGIRGFEAYRNEQRFIKDPDKRSLSGIEGIQTPSDTVVVFELTQPAPGFLKQLAHPQASVYARESIPETGPIQQPAGNGPFSLVQEDSSRLILAPNRDHPENPSNLDRLDIHFGLAETEAFQLFARRQVDGILGVSPAILTTITDSTGNLLTDFYSDYDLTRSDTFEEYPLYYNRESDQKAAVLQFLNSLQPNTWIAADAWGTARISKTDSSVTGELEPARFVLTQTDHPTARYMIARIAEFAASEGISFAMNASYAPFSDVTFTNRPFPSTDEVIQWNYPVYVLSRNLSGISVTGEAWNLQLQQLRLEEPEE